MYKKEQRGLGYIWRLLQEVQDSPPVNHPPCECECRSLAQDLARIEKEDGFSSENHDVLNTEREPLTSKHVLWEYWVGKAGHCIIASTISLMRLTTAERA